MKTVITLTMLVFTASPALGQGPGGTWEPLIEQAQWPQDMKAVHMVHLHTRNPSHSEGRRVLSYGTAPGTP